MEGIDVKFDDFTSLGFCIELIRRYGIRASEMGPFAWECDKKTEEQRAGTLNLVRFAILSKEDIFDDTILQRIQSRSKVISHRFVSLR